MEPTVGRIVHYVSHGTPPREDGSQAHPSACRAATVTEVISYTPPSDPNNDDSFKSTCHLAVFSPTGLFFNEVNYSVEHIPGTWHWPERV